MRWNIETRYKILLEINNAVVTRTNREDLFKALAKELHKHFTFDRLAIHLYDAKSQSISFFASADGVQPGGLLTLQKPADCRRPCFSHGASVAPAGHYRRPSAL